MAILYVIIVVCVILFIFCIYALVKAGKKTSKVKKLQKASDYSFENRVGHYKFQYMVKSFLKEDGLKIKIGINPVVGFSDLATASTAALNSVTIFVNGVEVNSTITRDGISGTSSFMIPKNRLVNGGFSAKIKTVTSWTLGGNTFDDVLEFDFKR